MNKEPIPLPNDLRNGTKHWLAVSTSHARFEVYLKQLAKVSISQVEMNNMMANEKYWPKSIQPNPYKVFIYTTEQLHDKNETRQMQFQLDLQHFLHLKTPVMNFNQMPKSNVHNSSKYKEHINICDAEFTDIRNQLLKQGVKTSQWIRNKFIMSKDVVVSDKDYFSSILSAWGKDPC